MMTIKINTKDGQIELTDDVIATIVGGAATEIFGVVGMASKKAIKDNFQALLGKENYAKGVVGHDAVWAVEACRLGSTRRRLVVAAIQKASPKTL